MALWGSAQASPVFLKINVIRPKRSGNPYLRAQRGAFTVPWGAGCFALLNGGTFPTLEEFANGATGAIVDTPLLRCVTLPRAEVGELRSLLERRRVSRERLMPSLDVVAREVVASVSNGAPQPSGFAPPEPSMLVEHVTPAIVER